MSEVEKKTPVKAIAKAEVAAKPVKNSSYQTHSCQTSSSSSCSDHL